MRLARLSGSQVNSAASVLASAFQREPLFRYLFPDSLARQRQLPRFFHVLVRNAISHGDVYVTSPRLEGVAIWYPSEKDETSLWRAVFSGALSVRLRIEEAYAMRRNGGAARARFTRYSDYANSMHGRLAPFRHRYLNVIGVAPPFRGQGYAGALLRPVLARMDEDGLPCYLSTQNPDNVPLYQHFGFEVVEEGTVPDSDVRHWAMMRNARND